MEDGRGGSEGGDGGDECYPMVIYVNTPAVETMTVETVTAKAITVVITIVETLTVGTLTINAAIVETWPTATDHNIMNFCCKSFTSN